MIRITIIGRLMVEIGNTSTAIEKSIIGNKDTINQSANDKVELNKLYDIKIQINGDRIKCYLDGKLIHDVVDWMNSEGVFANALVDSKGDKIL